VDEAPWSYFISEFKSSNPQRGVAWMPKRGLNIAECEIARGYKLHPKGSIEPIGFSVPRKVSPHMHVLHLRTNRAAVVALPG
jgi:coronin-1B/1C/6